MWDASKQLSPESAEGRTLLAAQLGAPSFLRYTAPPPDSNPIYDVL